MRTFICIAFYLTTYTLCAQSYLIKGKVVNELNVPIQGATVSFESNGTTTDERGQFSLRVQTNENIVLEIKHLSYLTVTQNIRLQPAKSEYNFLIVMKENIETIKEVIIESQKIREAGVFIIDKGEIKLISAANQGVEGVLMTLGGVSNSNELSTQYNVRGGNFDENLVYINGIAIFRPLLIRSGQQEGLSVVNSSMTKNITFSAGGFEAKYGDKMGSVLDILYRDPSAFSSEIEASLLGGGITIEGRSKSEKLGALLGFRYRNNSLFIDAKDINTNANPNFTDIQSFLKYKVTKQLSFSFLGNYALNNYNYTPKTRRTKFGDISNPLELIVFYEGQEKDKFKSLFGALSTEYIVNDRLKFVLNNAVYHSIEEEFFDILAQYNLGQINSDFSSENFGEVLFSEGIGSQLNHSRNELDALVNSTELKTQIILGNHTLEAGTSYQKEDIRDRLNEWEMIDSLGFSVRPPHHSINNQPYRPFEAEIIPFFAINARNNASLKRYQSFAQYSAHQALNSHKIWYNVGIRHHYWNLSSSNTNKNESNFSIRSQIVFKPYWKKDMLFKLALGTYNQPPFYKEFRSNTGSLNTLVGSQKSLQFVLGNEYAFSLWNRPFKLTTEFYYKKYKDLNSYTVDNVKIRYVASNNAKGYATGLEIRLNGEFVPGTESWVSLGLMKTEENIAEQGYIARPTDQRFKFGLLFQDYIPNIPNVRMYLNLVYNSGLPGGAPSYSNPYDFQHRLSPYKRADLGVFYVFKDANTTNSANWLKKIKTFSVGLELYNMFDIRNSITNTWLRDVYSKRFYAVPNYMTPRVLNLKTSIKF